jgi:hypothetical protein
MGNKHISYHYHHPVRRRQHHHNLLEQATHSSHFLNPNMNVQSTTLLI